MWNGMVSLYSARSFGDSPLLHWQFQVRSAWTGVSDEPEKNTNSRFVFDVVGGAVHTLQSFTRADLLQRMSQAERWPMHQEASDRQY